MRAVTVSVLSGDTFLGFIHSSGCYYHLSSAFSSFPEPEVNQILGYPWALGKPDTGLGIAAHVHFPFQHWNPIWLRAIQAWCHTLYESICVSPVTSRRPVSLLSSVTTGSDNVSISSSLKSLSPNWRDLLKTSHLAHTLYTLSSCGSLFCYHPLTTGESVSDDGWVGIAECC